MGNRLPSGVDSPFLRQISRKSEVSIDVDAAPLELSSSGLNQWATTSDPLASSLDDADSYLLFNATSAKGDHQNHGGSMEPEPQSVERSMCCCNFDPGSCIFSESASKLVFRLTIDDSHVFIPSNQLARHHHHHHHQLMTSVQSPTSPNLASSATQPFKPSSQTQFGALTSDHQLGASSAPAVDSVQFTFRPMWNNPTLSSFLAEIPSVLYVLWLLFVIAGEVLLQLRDETRVSRLLAESYFCCVCLSVIALSISLLTQMDRTLFRMHFQLFQTYFLLYYSASFLALAFWQLPYTSSYLESSSKNANIPFSSSSFFAIYSLTQIATIIGYITVAFIDTMPAVAGWKKLAGIVVFIGHCSRFEITNRFDAKSVLFNSGSKFGAPSFLPNQDVYNIHMSSINTLGIFLILFVLSILYRGSDVCVSLHSRIILLRSDKLRVAFHSETSLFDSSLSSDSSSINGDPLEVPSPHPMHSSYSVPKLISHSDDHAEENPVSQTPLHQLTLTSLFENTQSFAYRPLFYWRWFDAYFVSQSWKTWAIFAALWLCFTIVIVSTSTPTAPWQTVALSIGFVCFLTPFIAILDRHLLNLLVRNFEYWFLVANLAVFCYCAIQQMYFQFVGDLSAFANDSRPGQECTHPIELNPEDPWIYVVYRVMNVLLPAILAIHLDCLPIKPRTKFAILLVAAIGALRMWITHTFFRYGCALTMTFPGLASDTQTLRTTCLANVIAFIFKYMFSIYMRPNCAVILTGNIRFKICSE